MFHASIGGGWLWNSSCCSFCCADRGIAKINQGIARLVWLLLASEISNGRNELGDGVLWAWESGRCLVLSVVGECSGIFSWFKFNWCSCRSIWNILDSRSLFKLYIILVLAIITFIGMNASESGGLMSQCVCNLKFPVQKSRIHKVQV